MLNKNKIKFQNQDFKKKLVVARTYKRSLKSIRGKSFGGLLEFLSINTLPLKLLTIFLGLGLGYLLLVPNYFTVKNLKILELNTTQNSDSLLTCAKQQIHWPKNNLFLLSTKTLANTLEKNCREISRVEVIQKNYPHTLTLKLHKRYEEFLLTNQSGKYILANDGILLSQLSQTDWDLNASSTHSLIPMTLFNNSEEFYVGQNFSQTNLFIQLEEILKNFKFQFNNPIVKINLADKNFTNTELFTQTGYQIKINFHLINQEFLQNFEDLLNDITSSRISSVKYIDLRVAKKAYVCYKDAVCAQNSNSNPAGQ